MTENKLEKEHPATQTNHQETVKKCPKCFMDIDVRAEICGHCGVHLKRNIVIKIVGLGILKALAIGYLAIFTLMLITMSINEPNTLKEAPDILFVFPFYVWQTLLYAGVYFLVWGIAKLKKPEITISQLNNKTWYRVIKEIFLLSLALVLATADFGLFSAAFIINEKPYSISTFIAALILINSIIISIFMGIRRVFLFIVQKKLTSRK